MFDSSARLAALREQMATHTLQAYIIDSGDAHSNEYTAECDDRRAWISGFTGSAGTALVLANDAAYLWTDGRYHQVRFYGVRLRSARGRCKKGGTARLTPASPSPQQAGKQLNDKWTLMKHGAPDVPSWTDWLTTPSHSASALPAGSRVGLDPALITVADYTKLAPPLELAQIELVPIRENLVDRAWDQCEPGTRPARPKNEVVVHDERFAGESAASKIQRVRDLMKKPEVFGGDKKATAAPGQDEKRCWGLVLTQLDEIACESRHCGARHDRRGSLTTAIRSQGC